MSSEGNSPIVGVNHPSHYNIPGKKECIDEMLDNLGRLGVYFFDRGNEYKYVYRAGLKDGESREKDIDKAKWYCSHASEVERSWTWVQKIVMFIAERICF